MATEKLFSVVGISNHPTHGYKVRFANDILRIKNLAKGGHEDIRMVELDQPMTKLEAVIELKNSPDFQDSSAQATIVDFVERNTAKVKPESAANATKAALPKVSAPKTAKKAVVTEDESAPF